MKKISIIGCGHLGYALAVTLARSHDMKVFVYDVEEEVIKKLQEEDRHPYFHQQIERPPNLVPSSETREVLQDTEAAFMAVPAQVMRQAIESIVEDVPRQTIIINLAKALERKTELRMSQVLEEYLDRQPIATLSGGMLAGELVKNHPVGAHLASRDNGALEALAPMFEPTTIRAIPTTDITGVEYAGSLKNVLAIQAGIVDGLQWETSSKAFFVTQAAQEMEQLAVHLGGQPETFRASSPSWMGDLLTTCFGNSRNRYLGELIGKGWAREEAIDQLQEENKHAEGVITLKSVRQLIQETEVEAPFLEALYAVVYVEGDPNEQFTALSQSS